LTGAPGGRKTARVTGALAGAGDTSAVECGARGGAELIGISPAITRLRADIRAIARAGFRAVLVQGESGVGKEVVAEVLRATSPRADGPHEVFDCPAVPEDHLESELFGTTRGAFPGAIDKRGALERAHGGTIFFDEVAAMRRDHQAKILRAIEGKSFRRVGGSGNIAVDVAVIAAAHEDLAALAAEGAFRHDLYYRMIRDGVLVIPPLRDRPEDVAVLARHYLRSAHAHEPVPLEGAAVERLAEYDWPGNVRQLHTALRIALRLEPRALTAAAVGDVLRGFARAPARRAPAAEVGAAPAGPDAPVGIAHAGSGGTCTGAVGGFHAITATIQRRALLQAYEAAAGNKTAAGVLLGFHLSPGEESVSGGALTEGRRNLALRKFRYWCSRLGIADALARRPRVTAAESTFTVETSVRALDPAHGNVPDR
jgi:two-component system response regulator PilR (NtrC family)